MRTSALAVAMAPLITLLAETWRWEFKRATSAWLGHGSAFPRALNSVVRLITVSRLGALKSTTPARVASGFHQTLEPLGSESMDHSHRRV